MKIRQITDSRNQHIVAIEKTANFAATSRTSLHTAGATLSSSAATSPTTAKRLSSSTPSQNHQPHHKTGRTIYDVTE